MLPKTSISSRYVFVFLFLGLFAVSNSSLAGPAEVIGHYSLGGFTYSQDSDLTRQLDADRGAALSRFKESVQLQAGVGPALKLTEAETKALFDAVTVTQDLESKYYQKLMSPVETVDDLKADIIVARKKMDKAMKDGGNPAELEIAEKALNDANLKLAGPISRINYIVDDAPKAFTSIDTRIRALLQKTFVDDHVNNPANQIHLLPIIDPTNAQFIGKVISKCETVATCQAAKTRLDSIKNQFNTYANDGLNRIWYFPNQYGPACTQWTKLCNDCNANPNLPNCQNNPCGTAQNYCENDAIYKGAHALVSKAKAWAEHPAGTTWVLSDNYQQAIDLIPIQLAAKARYDLVAAKFQDYLQAKADYDLAKTEIVEFTKVNTYHSQVGAQSTLRIMHDRRDLNTNVRWLYGAGVEGGGSAENFLPDGTDLAILPSLQLSTATEANWTVLSYDGGLRVATMPEPNGPDTVVAAVILEKRTAGRTNRSGIQFSLQSPVGPYPAGMTVALRVGDAVSNEMIQAYKNHLAIDLKPVQGSANTICTEKNSSSTPNSLCIVDVRPVVKGQLILTPSHSVLIRNNVVERVAISAPHVNAINSGALQRLMVK